MVFPWIAVRWKNILFNIATVKWNSVVWFWFKTSSSYIESCPEQLDLLDTHFHTFCGLCCYGDHAKAGRAHPYAHWNEKKCWFLPYLIFLNDMYSPFISLPSSVCSTSILSTSLPANMLDSMLMKNGWKRGSDRKGEESTSRATASAENMLWCHCYPDCPEDSVNNTCMYGGAHTSMPTHKPTCTTWT